MNLTCQDNVEVMSERPLEYQDTFARMSLMRHRILLGFLTLDTLSDISKPNLAAVTDGVGMLVYPKALRPLFGKRQWFACAPRALELPNMVWTAQARGFGGTGELCKQAIFDLEFANWRLRPEMLCSPLCSNPLAPLVLGFRTVQDMAPAQS